MGIKRWDVLLWTILFWVGVGIIYVIGTIFAINSHNKDNHSMPKEGWHCTAQVRIGDSLPEQYECTQYTKGE